MKALLKSILSVVFFTSSLSASAATSYQDWWINPSMSGMGISIGQQDNVLVAAWYHFGDNNESTYLMLSGGMNGNKLSGDLYRATGPAPGPDFNPNAVTRTAVGTASLVFNSLNSATFTYSYDGKSGTIPLERFTFKEEPIAGKWRFSGIANTRSCTYSSNNGTVLSSGQVNVSKTSGNNYTLAMEYDNGARCSYNLSLSPTGSIMSGTGSLSCNFGWKGKLQVNRLRAADDFLTIDYSVKVTSGESCIETGKLGAVRY